MASELIHPAPLIPLYLYLGDPIARPAHLYDYLLAEQGVIKRLETWYVSADMLLAPLTETLIGLRLAPYPLHPLRLKVPLIPGVLLREMLADARRNLDLEFIYHFRFDPDQGWYVTRPEQAQDRTHVGYVDHNQAGIVAECHSHNTMPAFFSPTDNRDEQGGRFYAVIGHLDRPQPQIVVRLGMYGHWLRNIPGLALFDGLGPFVDTYDDPNLDHDPAVVDPEPGWPAWLGLFQRRSP